MFKVRTAQAIDVKTADGLIFNGTVEEDVLDRNGDVAIPEGATVELMARKNGDELTLDLESVTVNGRRYAVLADPSTVGTSGRVESGARTIGANRDTAVYVGGGALLGTIIGAITGGLDFSNYFTPLAQNVTANNLADAKKQGAVLAWGNFLTLTLNFMIVAAALFIVIRLMNKLKEREPPPEKAKLTIDQQLLTEIRDALKK